MTPIDLVPGALDHTDPTVTNISRFLQTLDEDGNPENGILISEETRDNARGKSLDFTLSDAEFEAAAKTLLGELFGQAPHVLVSAQDAQAHLQSAIIALVETTRDGKGVWFISGVESLYATFEAMGYAVATDRLWQAEIYKRSAQGRLAEIFGEDQLESDIFMRTIGYSDEELQEGFDALNSDTQTMISAYVAGFNRRISEIRADAALLPYEFVTLNAPLEDWTVSDVLAWTALMLRNFDSEGFESLAQIENAALSQSLEEKFPDYFQQMFDDLRWINDPDALPYVSESKTRSAGGQNFSFHELAENMAEHRSKILENLKKINAHVKMGSYAWAVSGSRTASGNPIIYSGPQMGFSVPSVVLEGSIQAGGLTVSGMTVPGLPGIIIGRTRHHAWSMQVGHAHTVDYYLERKSDVRLHRIETIRCAGMEEDTRVPVYRSSHGPVISPMPYDEITYAEDPANPIIAWKYSHWGYEFETISAFYDLARAETMDAFGDAIERVGVSQHFCYADREGNIAYWMSGRDPLRPDGEYRFPQGFTGKTLEWNGDRLIDRATDRNTPRGFYSGWNNKSQAGYGNALNTSAYYFGPFHRAHVIDDYLSASDHLFFEDVRDLALNIATTDSFGDGGNPWKFVADDFTDAVTEAGLTLDRQFALGLLTNWDGHFVEGGASEWVAGTDRSDAWILMDTWIREALRLTFEDELGTELYEKQPPTLLFNVFLRGLRGETSGIVNAYNWFQNPSQIHTPQTSDAIIVQSLDDTLAMLGEELPWGTDKRGYIWYQHDLFRDTLLDPVHSTPFSSRSTYAHCVEFGESGPVRIESMFPLGESGNILMGSGGTPVFDDHFFSMTDSFDAFAPRVFPPFESLPEGSIKKK
ncbi:MAG: hypothetical protein B6245_10930 [Desulfobacteraceae bacterium 4572_88]|nr:MAG: hypothetical protein B6245_10930 [Desulfobacteraceae bacterium 4572_88]